MFQSAVCTQSTCMLSYYEWVINLLNDLWGQGGQWVGHECRYTKYWFKGLQCGIAWSGPSVLVEIGVVVVEDR